MNKSEIESDSSHNRFFNPATLFLIIGLVVGIAFCIFIPYGAGFDEEQHVVRVFDIAALNLLPNRSHAEGTPSYGDFISQSYQRRFYQTPADDLISQDFLTRPIDTNVTVAFPTRSIYPPVDFVPQALIARFFWRKYNAPVVPVAMLIRFSGLLVYLLGAYFAIRLLPFGKWVLMLLALAPMALFEAATINADGFTNVVSFLFIALCFNLYAQQEKKIKAWKIWLLLAIILLLGLTKTGTILVLPLLLILPYRKMGNKIYPVLIFLAAALSAGLMIWWNIISIPGSHFSEGGGQSLSSQLQVILGNPLGFLQTYILGNLLAVGRYFRDWVGVYGYWVGAVPEVVYWLFPVGIISACLIGPRTNPYGSKQRWISGLTFLFAAAGIAFIYSYLHFDPDDTTVLGRQGRYFIFATPLLFLAFSGAGFLSGRWDKLLKILTVSSLLVVIVFYSLGIYTTYYTFCGSSIYTFQPCTQPVYKNLDISPTAPQVKLNMNTPITQEFVSVCGAVNRIDVNVKKIPTVKDGQIRLALLNNDQVIGSQDFRLDDIPENGLLNLYIQGDLQNMVGSKYKISVEAPSLPVNNSVGLAINVPKQYHDGAFTVAGEGMNSDLVFHYSCVNPWSGF